MARTAWPRIVAGRLRSGCASVLLLLTLPAVGQAQFDYTTNNDSITITRYTGSGDLVTIPDTINGLPVTSIGGHAFMDSTSVASIAIPESVVSIGAGAFLRCTSLTNVTIPDSIASIADGTFSGCARLTSVTIPNSVTSIGTNGFAGCIRLTGVTIPNSVTWIGDRAFSGCGLANVTIPDSVASIADDTFSGCTRLTSVTIPNSVTSIGVEVFAGCINLTGVTIPNSVTWIGYGAFSGCNLTSVTIPESVTGIDEEAFGSCTRLTSAYFQGNAPPFFPAIEFDGTAPTFTIYYPRTATGWTTPTWNGYPAQPYDYTPAKLGTVLGLMRGLGTVTPSFSNLHLGTNYQLQVSTDLTTWSNTGAAFIATHASEVYAQPFNVGNGNALFFRLQIPPIPGPPQAKGVVVGWGDNRFGQSTTGASNVVAIAAGYEDSLLLLRDGSVAAYGAYWDNYGFSNPPVTVPLDLTNAVAVGAGNDHCVALRADGTVVAWDVSGLLEVPVSATNVTAISVGWYQNLALRADGSVASWGAYPNLPADLSNVVAIAGGYSQDNGIVDLALKPNGEVVAWDTQGTYVPVPADWTNIVAISGGAFELLGLRADGTVALWPSNPQVAATLADVVAISASPGSDNHISLALRADGTVFGWGFNFYGGPDVPPGLSNVVAVASGGDHQLALVGGGAPFLTTRLPNRTAVSSSTVYFRVEATGLWPLTYQWRFNGADLPGATRPVLCVSNVQPSQAGAYSVSVSNAVGVVVSPPAVLSVEGVRMITPPQGQIAFIGGPASFNVTVLGSPPLSYQWRMDGLPIPGATNPELTLTNIQTSQAGGYSVVVTNAFGAATSADALLTVVPVLIAGQPQDQVVFLGEPATLQVAAEGLGPLDYQWNLNGNPIPGPANGVLALSSAQLSDAGAYSVVVSNRLGSATSSVATLSVLSVAAWGSLTEAQLPSGLSNAVAIAASALYFAALKADGTVISSECPEGCTNFVSESRVIAIACGETFTVALKEDGTVTAWGNYLPADPGALGRLTNAVAIAARDYHCIVLLADGSVTEWGEPLSEWGDPVRPVPAPKDLGDVVAVAQGDYHSLALRSDGTVIGWGSDKYGQVSVPANLANIVGIAACGDHSLVLGEDGTVTAFGFNYDGRLTVPSGLTNVMAVAAGSYLNLALGADGNVTVWGAGPTNVPGALRNVGALAAGDFALALVGNGPPSRSARVSISSRAGGGYAVSVATEHGRVYRLEYKSALSDTRWVALPLVAGNGGLHELVDPTAGGAERFYRVRRW